MNPQDILEILKGLIELAWSYNGVKVIVCHALVNVVVAVAAAQKAGEVNLSKLSEFLTEKLLPYVTVYLALKVFGEAAGISFLAPIVLAVIEATLAGDLLDNWDKLGLPLPDKVRDLVIKSDL